MHAQKYKREKERERSGITNRADLVYRPWFCHKLCNKNVYRQFIFIKLLATLSILVVRFELLEHSKTNIIKHNNLIAH